MNFELFSDVKLSTDNVLEDLLEHSRKLDKPYSTLCRRLIESPPFVDQPGSLHKHHVWLGGLAQHTLEVLTAAKQIFETGARKMNWNVLATAAIFHDSGKIYDNVVSPSSGPYDTTKQVWVYENPYNQSSRRVLYERTPHYTRVYHVSRSYYEWMTDSTAYILALGSTREEIAHCILSHQGRIEWKAVVEPQTPEARTLHIADMISSQIWHPRAEKSL